MGRICVTGSEGVVGVALVAALERRGFEVHKLDIQIPRGSEGYGDIRDRDQVEAAIDGAVGIIHLAAISRVIWAEQDPSLCWETNVTGTRRVLEAALSSPRRPWVIFASSREVYGNRASLPVKEGTPHEPANIYGRSKSAAEDVVEDGRTRGLSTAILRLSNVYGGVNDHPDRVIPAFCLAALSKGAMHVNGPEITCDFTHLDDTVRGFLSVLDKLESSCDPLPAMNLSTGVGTSLEALARLTNRLGGGGAEVHIAPSLMFAVEQFVGDTALARQVLEWRAEIGLEPGITRLMQLYSEQI